MNKSPSNDWDFEYDRYPETWRNAITTALIIASGFLIFNSDRFGASSSFIALGAAAIAWLLEWSIQFHPSSRQVRLRRGFRLFSKYPVLSFDDIASLRLDFHPSQGRQAESYGLVAVFKYGGLTNFKLARFETLKDAAHEASRLHRATGIPVSESNELGSRRQAYDDVGALIKDSEQDLKQKA